MAYVIPTFPMVCNVCTGGIADPSNVRTQYDCNLAWGRRVTTCNEDVASAGLPQVIAYLLLPKGADVRDYSTSTGGDAVEVPAWSGRWYLVDYVDDVGGGFPNEHRFACLEKLIPWPTPIPTCDSATSEETRMELPGGPFSPMPRSGLTESSVSDTTPRHDESSVTRTDRTGVLSTLLRWLSRATGLSRSCRLPCSSSR